MKKYLAILLVVLSLLACRALSPQQAATPTRIAVSTPVLEATAFAPNPAFTLIRIYPKDGDLHSQLAIHAKKAIALGQTPFLEFDATWCPPCQAITASLADKNPLMMDAYRSVYLIHVDTDEWGWGNTDANFPVDGIPSFFGLDSAGKANGTATSGAAWGKDIPENISPVLDDFFHP